MRQFWEAALEKLRTYVEDVEPHADPVDREVRVFYVGVFGDPICATYDCIDVEDVEATLARAWDLGGTVVSIPESRPGGGPLSAIFSDPAGKVVLIAQATRSPDEDDDA
jgi:hypothetical protein